MPSENILLGSGIVPIEEHKAVVNKRAPAWRFHISCPEGKVCKTDAELDQADKEGWVDHPGKVRLLPGHEKVWEAYQKSIGAIKSAEIVSETKNEIDLEAERKAYEEAKVPKGLSLCTLCGKTFSSEKALNMHGIAVHRERKKK